MLRASTVPDAHDSAYLEAKSLANRKIGFVGHALVFATTLLLLLVTAGFQAAVIVGLSWGIGLVCHGFFAVAAPLLRKRWLDDDVARKVHVSVSRERREVEGRHARSLEQLSASIAHEIRNPVTAAKSLVAQMGEDPLSPENVEYARVALEELDRVERSISHLLKFARDEEIRPRPMRLADVVDSAVESFRDRIARLAVTVTREIDGDREVSGDPEKLRRVVINLVQNALDALEESATRAPRLDIACGENLARTEAWLRVRDNGPGIPAESAARIFSPFYTSKAEGTGLGLAISKKVVEAHGGTLEARSEPGGGTELTMVLPTVLPGEAPDAQAPR